MDTLMSEIANQKPFKLHKKRVYTLDTMNYSLETYYNFKRNHIFSETLTFFDDELYTFFSTKKSNKNANTYIASQKDFIYKTLMLNSPKYKIQTMIDRLLFRSKELNLFYDGRNGSFMNAFNKKCTQYLSSGFDRISL